MRTPRVPAEEQYRLIMECRKSGLSDHQWCLNNDINPGTFYNWVKRLRNNGCKEIPARNKALACESQHQEVVKIEMESLTVPCTHESSSAISAMELELGNVKLRIPNGTDPMLLAQVVQVVMGCVC